MVYNRYYILELTHDQLNAKWSADFRTPDAQKAPIVLIAKSVLSQQQLATTIERLLPLVKDGEGSYSLPGVSLTVHTGVEASIFGDRLAELAKDVREGHGF